MQGMELSTALKRHPDVFRHFVNQPGPGCENTGSLTGGLSQLAAYTGTRERHARAHQAGPALSEHGVVRHHRGHVHYKSVCHPGFCKLYSGFKAELPWATKILIATSNFTVSYWHLILITMILAVLGIRLYVKTTEGRLPLAPEQAEAATGRGHHFSLHPGTVSGPWPLP